MFPGLTSAPPSCRGLSHCHLQLETLEGRDVPAATVFHVTNLVSDQAGVAVVHDPQLVGAWGIALSAAGGGMWVSANGTGVSTLYTGDVNGSPFVKNALTVALPGGRPTGQVFNSTNDFVVSSGAASGRAIFVFASETGFITGWNPVVPAPGSRVSQVAVSTPGQAIYTGVAMAPTPAGNMLYAADFKNGEIDAFNASFAPVNVGDRFVDPGLSKNFKPFNIQLLGGKLYVTYARADRTGDGLPDGGGGFVSVFDTEGRFLQRLASRGTLNQPWGLALAPAGFGEFGGALLVGNHGSGKIAAFDPTTGKFLGLLRDAGGGVVKIDGLFGLSFGNGVSAGDRNALYFAAAPDDGAHGLLGSLRATDKLSRK